ncbi:MAG: hypothetical protein A7315_11480 [Candidatus Altiarchaeales archaeon WOR_SM1_79]|nr:MAG: hypothetical protein A7315_11480 [Candidatus Altiarchaeales archaeon WOR_SM1_79]
MVTLNEELDKYTKLEEIQALINGEVMESLILGYKGSDALDKTPKKRYGISKDISAFANSAGGTIIYGIGEDNHRPRGDIEWMDDIGRERETLENVILSRISRRIENFRVHAIKNPDDDSEGILVVNVLQSHTVHMASDNRYYKRRNFRVVPMEDYEVRDIMFRRKKPDIDVVLKPQDKEVVWEENFSAPIDIEVVIHNYGGFVARHISGGFKFPGSISNPQDATQYTKTNATEFDCDNRLLQIPGTLGAMAMATLPPLISQPNTCTSIGKITPRLQKDYRSGTIEYWILAEHMKLKEGKFELSLKDNRIQIRKV